MASFFSLFRKAQSKSRGKASSSRPLDLEYLEDRLAPATDITISTGPTAGGTFVGGIFTLTGNPATANVNNVEIQNLLNVGTLVIIDTASAAANPGDITVTASVAKTAGLSSGLILRANNTITVTGGSDITSASSQLNMTLNSDREANGDGAIAIGAGSVIDSNGGPIILGGGLDPTLTAAQGTASQPIGIDLNGAQLVSGTGSIRLLGRGHDLAGSANNTGIQLVGGSLLQSTEGDIFLNGRGGAGTNGNVGVALSGAGTLVTSADGDVQITGIGGAATTTSNYGVSLSGGAQVSSTGTTALAGTVTLTGTRGSGTNSNYGVFITAATVTSVVGAIQINTSGGGAVTGNDNTGVYLPNGQVTSTGTSAIAATITISGTGGAGTDSNRGVALEGNTLVSSFVGAIQITGTGAGSGSANRGVSLGGGTVSSSLIGANAATITITGTGAAGTSSNTGVFISGSTVISPDGNIQITGTGGAGSGNDNRGVDIRGSGQVKSTNINAVDAATITITGTGGSGTDSNDGVLVFQPNSLVTSAAGAIQITGTVAGPVTTTNNRGVAIFDGGQVLSTGTGADAAPITIQGTGGAGTNVNGGVVVSGANALVTSVDGDIRISGTGGAATGNSNRGVQIANTAQVRSTGITAADAATITITGIGGAGTLSNDGVEVVGANSRVTSVAGAIQVTGTSPGPVTANINHGIYLLSGGQVTSTGTGANAAPITLDGTGGNGTVENVGVRVEGTNSLVTSVDGDIELLGTGGIGTGSSNRGVDIRAGGRVTSTGVTAANAAIITITGAGGSGTLANDGVLVTDATSRVESVAGAILVIGTVAGLVTGDSNLGVDINNGAQVSSTGIGTNAAPITLIGTGGTGISGNVGVGLLNGALVTAVDGDIQITGTGGNGTGQVNDGIGLFFGGTVSSTGTAAGAATITLGGTGGAGTNFNAGINIENAGSLVTSVMGAIQFTGQGGDGSADSNYGVAVHNGGVVSSTGTGAGAATITFNGTGGDGTDSNHGVDIESLSATVTSVVGAIQITGQAGGSGAGNIGVFVGGSGVVSSTGTGASAATITLTGTGGNGTSQNFGVDVEGAGALVTSVDGAIQITGTGGDGSQDSNVGASVRNGGAVRSTGTGVTAAPITIVGNAGAGTDVNFGVEVASTGSTVTSVDGDIQITGQGGTGSASLNIGIVVSFGGVVSSTGTTAGAAAITLDGTGGTGTFNNYGIDVEGAGARVTSVVGAIELTGQGGAGTNVSNVGATVRDGGVISSTGTGADAATITVVGTGGASTAGNFGVEITGAGALVTSVAGAVGVTGHGRGAGANNDGVRVSSSGAIESTGAASVTVTGDGSTTGGASGRGVRLLSPGTVRAPGTGNVAINGTGSGGNADIEFDNLSITKTGGTYTFNDTVLGTSTLTANAGAYNITFNDGGTINGAVTLNNTGTVTLGSAGDAFVFGSLAGTVPATGIALNATMLTVGNSSSTSFAGTITGAGAVVKQGTGTLSLSNPNSTFTGNLTINQGSVAATGGHNDTNPTSALGNPAVVRNIAVGTGASLQFSANDVFGNFASSLAATLVVNGGTVTSTGTFFNVLGPIQLNGGTLSAPAGGANAGFQAFSLSGSVTVGGAAASTISTAGANNGIHLSTSTTFTVADATGNALADLIISAPLINRTAGNGGAAGALVKAGVGTATISSASTYTGATTVNAGTLLVTGSTTSNTTVNSGGTLGGTGTIAGAVLVNAGGTLAPGTSPGIVSVGDTTLSATSTFAVEINGTTVGTQYDQLNVTGTVALGGATLDVTLGAFTPADGNTFVIINNDGPITDTIDGTFDNLPEGAVLIVGSSRFVITYMGGTGNDVVLTAQALPTVTLSLADSPLVENGGVATVTATLSAVSVQDVTVNLGFTGDATNPGDYTPSAASIVIFAGNLSGSITLTGANDALDEPDEAIVVDITSVTNGAEDGVQQVTATILDTPVVYRDLNANGFREPTEPRLGGRTVFRDTNGNDELDSGEPTAVTAADGTFSLPAGAGEPHQLLAPGEFATGADELGARISSSVTAIPPFGDLFQGGPSENEAFVRSVYRAVLLREGEQAGVDNWVAFLDAGGNRLQVAAGFWTSPEHRALQVNGYYRDFLGRTPNSQEVGGWVSVFQSGATEEQVVQGFLTSGEFQAQTPGDSDFINDLYFVLLGRQRGAGEFPQAESEVSSGGRAAMVQTFLGSQESRLRAIDGFYTGLLFREGEAAGRDNWLFVLGSGADYGTVAISFLGSAEFFISANS